MQIPHHLHLQLERLYRRGGTDGNLTLTTTGHISNEAKILAGQTLTLNAANIDNLATAEISGLNTQINATGPLTNRGLMDGGDTFIHVATLNNIGTGAIFGNHLAIQANTLLNDTETISGVTTAATIAARNRLDMAANTITNREHATIFSTGDIAIGGGLDADHHATVGLGQSQATTLNNNSATIEALGDVALNLAQINNTNEHMTTQYVRTSVSSTIANSVDVRGNMGSPAPDVGNIRQYQMSSFSTDGPLLFGRVYN